MRLIFLSCILALALLSTSAGGQQQQPGTSAKQPVQPSAAKDSGSAGTQAKAPKTTHRVARKRRSRAAYKHGVKRTAYRPAYTQNAVEVINGASTQKVVFHNDETVAGSKKDANAPMKVEVMNGSSTDTQYFARGQESAGAVDLNRPVVVAVQSSDTKVVGGNKHEVVTRINSSGSGSAKSASSSGDVVTKAVSPRPKRPAYQSDSQ